MTQFGGTAGFFSLIHSIKQMNFTRNDGQGISVKDQSALYIRVPLKTPVLFHKFVFFTSIQDGLLKYAALFSKLLIY